MRDVLFYCFLSLNLASSCRADSENLAFEGLDEEAVIVSLSCLPRFSTLSFTTSEDRILAFTSVEGNIPHLNEFIKIYDGDNIHAALMPLETNFSDEKGKSRLFKTVYSTGNSAIVEIIKNVPYEFHLKIQKAVHCPSELGTNSSCVRLIDEVSCYCVVNNVGTWYDQNTFCQRHGFQLLSIESPLEETAIYDTWDRVTYFWTSLTDLDTENVFVWGSTGVPLNPGYVNWHLNQPDGTRNCETLEHDCVHLNYLNGGWNDALCSNEYEAICERQP